MARGETRWCLENGKVLKIIHNYGHGGAGVTLAWGCATDVLGLVEQMVREEMGHSERNERQQQHGNVEVKLRSKL